VAVREVVEETAELLTLTPYIRDRKRRKEKKRKEKKRKEKKRKKKGEEEGNKLGLLLPSLSLSFSPPSLRSLSPSLSPYARTEYAFSDLDCIFDELHRLGSIALHLGEDAEGVERLRYLRMFIAEELAIDLQC